MRIVSLRSSQDGAAPVLIGASDVVDARAIDVTHNYPTVRRRGGAGGAAEESGKVHAQLLRRSCRRHLLDPYRLPNRRLASGPRSK